MSRETILRSTRLCTPEKGLRKQLDCELYLLRRVVGVCGYLLDSVLQSRKATADHGTRGQVAKARFNTTEGKAVQRHAAFIRGTFNSKPA